MPRRPRAAIVILSNTIDVLITQLSDNDAVRLEIHKGQASFYTASVYLDYNELIENNKTFGKDFIIYQRSKTYYSHGRQFPINNLA